MADWPRHVEAVVVDASLATMWSVPERLTEKALARASSWAKGGTRLLAPCLLVAEVTNAIYKRIVRGEMELATAQAALSVVLAFPIELREEPGLAARAMELARQHGRPNTYDSQYLALAERHESELWTGDERFYNAVKSKIGWVRFIGEEA
jgi:predicted nucleic acid-binding protein